MNLSRQIFLLPFLLILLLFLALAACSPAPGVLPVSASAVAPASPAVPEVRLLTLDYPAAIHAGDFGRVTLTFEVESVEEMTGLQDVYDTHNVLAEAQLEMAGGNVRPATIVSEPLLPGQKVTFYWTVSPAEVGNYEGTVWFYLHFVPKTSGAESRILLSAQLVEIEATDLFGIKSQTARWIGFPGIFIGIVLAFPFLENALKWVWTKVRKGQDGKGTGK